MRGGEITRSVDDIAFVIEKCCIRGVGCREASTTCAMLNNFQSIMVNVYYSGFARILDKQVGDTSKSISLANMFASGDTLRFAQGYSIANTSNV